MGDPFERARTRLVQGTLLRRSKKRAAGFTAIGTPLWAERARSELERSASVPAAAR